MSTAKKLRGCGTSGGDFLIKLVGGSIVLSWKRLARALIIMVILLEISILYSSSS